MATGDNVPRTQTRRGTGHGVADHCGSNVLTRTGTHQPWDFLVPCALAQRRTHVAVRGDGVTPGNVAQPGRRLFASEPTAHEQVSVAVQGPLADLGLCTGSESDPHEGQRNPYADATLQSLDSFPMRQSGAC